MDENHIQPTRCAHCGGRMTGNPLIDDAHTPTSTPPNIPDSVRKSAAFKLLYRSGGACFERWFEGTLQRDVNKTPVRKEHSKG